MKTVMHWQELAASKLCALKPPPFLALASRQWQGRYALGALENCGGERPGGAHTTPRTR